MQKSDLTEVIKKYHLGGITNVMKFEVKEKNLTLQANATGVFSYIEANVDLEDGEFGVFYTDKLLSLLNVLDNEIDLNYDFKKNKITSLNIKDKTMEASYMLADLTSVDDFYKDARVRDFNQINFPDFDVEVEIKKDLIDKFLKAKRALSDSKMVGLNLAGEELEFIVNYSKSQSSRITFKVPAQVETSIPLQIHNVDLLAAIFTANTDFKTAKMKISGGEGKELLLFEFISDSYIAKYLVKALEV